MTPMQESVRSANAHRDAVQTEKTALQAEMDQWKERTKHLVEQCNKADPEEQKRLMYVQYP